MTGNVGRQCQGHGRYAVPCRRTGEPTGSPELVRAFFCHDHEHQRRRWEHQQYFNAGLELASITAAPSGFEGVAQ